MADLLPGDVVRLKSGGPLMTVVNTQEPHASSVVWFASDEDKNPCTGKFLNITLVKIDAED